MRHGQDKINGDLVVIFRKTVMLWAFSNSQFSAYISLGMFWLSNCFLFGKRVLPRFCSVTSSVHLPLRQKG